MSANSRKNLAAPIVIALLAIGFVAYELWLSPAPKSVPKPVAPPAPVIESPAPAPPPTHSGPLETPVAVVWSTYHGGPNLAGYSEANLPDQPVVRWRYQADGPVYYTPVADDLGVYVSTRNAKVCALDFSGKERWTRQLMREKGPDGVEKPERIEAPLASFLSMVFAGTTSGKLYALDAASGEQQWVYDVEGTILGTVNLQPAHDTEPNRLFVISQDDGVLHCVDAATGTRLWAAEPIERCDGSAAVARGLVIYGSCAAALHVFSAGDGKILQNIALDADSQVAGGAALAGDSIYSGSHSGYFYHADSRSGRVLWVNKDSQGEVFSTPALSPEFVVFSSNDGNVYGLDRRSGMRKWTFTTDGTPTSAVIAGSKVILGVDGVLQFLKLETGEALWSQEISDEIASPAIIRDMVMVGGGDGTVTAFGAPAG